jgi:hypothetical protein
MADAPVVIPEFDGIETTEPAPSGYCKVFSNGNIFVVPGTGKLNGSMELLNFMASEYGFHPGNIDCRPCFRADLPSATFTSNSDDDVITTPSGAKRIRRTPEAIEKIQTFARAVLEDRLSELAAGPAARFAEQIEKQAEATQKKVARKIASDAKFAVASGTYGDFNITKTAKEFEVKALRKLTPAEYRSLAGARIGGEWDCAAKIVRVPLDKEVQLGRYLARVNKAVAAEKQAAKTNESEWRAAISKLELVPYCGWQVRCLSLGNIEIKSPYDERAVKAFRGMRGTFIKYSKTWELPLSSAPALVQYLAENGILLSANLQERSSQLAAIAKKGEEKAVERARQEAAERQARYARGEREYRIYADRSGVMDSGTRLPALGEFWRASQDGELLKCESCSRGRYIEDASSLGGTMFSEHQFLVKSRVALPHEIQAYDAKVAEARAVRRAQLEAAAFLDDLAKTIDAQNDRPTGEANKGLLADSGSLKLFDGATIYGGGRWFVLEKNGTTLWHVHNNGADGDCWDRGNAGNSIAYRATVEPGVRDKLLDLAELHPVFNDMLPERGYHGISLEDVLRNGKHNDVESIRAFRTELAAREADLAASRDVSRE